MASCQPERNFVAVHRVHFAVVYHDTYITGIRTGERTLLHAVHKAFYNGRYEPGVNGSSHNAVVYYELAAPFQRYLLLVAHIELKLLVAETIRVWFGHSFGVWLDD